MAKLGELYKITSGGTPSRNHSEYFENGTIPWVKTGDLKDKYLFETDEKISQLGLENSSARIYLKNTVLLAMYGATIGATSILEIDAATNQACAAFSPREDVLPEYLYTFLESQKDKFIKDAVGGAQPNLSAGYLKNIDFDYPPLEQQTKITNTLNKIDELLLLRKQQLAKLDELVKARFVEMFGELHRTEYSIKTLDELCEFIKDGTHQTPTYVNATEGYKFLSSKDVTSGYIDWSSIKYISEELHQELYKRIAPQRGDILLAKNGTTGIPAIVETDETFDIYVSLALLRLKPNNNVRYIWSALRMPETKAQFDNSLKGVGVPNLHLGEIKKTKIIVPPLSLQNQFAAFVERVDQQKQRVQKSLEKLELMKKALMQEYFG